jgi:hypothetical protein
MTQIEFWQRFAEWYALYGPPGDLRVQLEALAMHFVGITHEIGEAMLPVLMKMRDGVRDAVEALAPLASSLR